METISDVSQTHTAYCSNDNAVFREYTPSLNQINPVYFKWVEACSVLPEDGIVMPKHVGIKWL